MSFLADVGRANIPGRINQAVYQPMTAIQNIKGAKQEQELRGMKIRAANEAYAEQNAVRNIANHPFLQGLDPKSRELAIKGISDSDPNITGGVGKSKYLQKALSVFMEKDEFVDGLQKSIVSEGAIGLMQSRKTLDAAELTKDPVRIAKAKAEHKAKEDSYNYQISAIPSVREALAKQRKEASAYKVGKLEYFKEGEKLIQYEYMGDGEWKPTGRTAPLFKGDKFDKNLLVAAQIAGIPVERVRSGKMTPEEAKTLAKTYSEKFGAQNLLEMLFGGGLGGEEGGEDEIMKFDSEGNLVKGNKQFRQVIK